MSKLLKQHEQVLREYFYLDIDDITVRRAKNGYFSRYKQHDKIVYYSNKNGYLMVHIPKTRRSITIALLLCLLRDIDVPEGYDVDHIDGNLNNNHRNNLRIVTRQINNRNRRKRSDNTSGITGIHWSTYHGHYIIRKTIGNKRQSTSRKTLNEAMQVLAEFCALDKSYTKRHDK